MKYFKKELWKGINGISQKYSIEKADEVFLNNTIKYNQYFRKHLSRVLPADFIRLYNLYDGFHDMYIAKIEYCNNILVIHGDKILLRFFNTKCINLQTLNHIDELGYIEIIHFPDTDSFRVGILFSWDDSVEFICEGMEAVEIAQK